MLQLEGMSMPVPGLNPVRRPAIGANPGFIPFPSYIMADMNLPGLMPGVVSFAIHPQTSPIFQSGPPNAGYGISYVEDMSQNIAQQYEQISHDMAQQVDRLNYMAAHQQVI